MPEPCASGFAVRSARVGVESDMRRVGAEALSSFPGHHAGGGDSLRSRESVVVLGNGKVFIRFEGELFRSLAVDDGEGCVCLGAKYSG